LTLREFFSRPPINATVAGVITALSWSAIAWGLTEPGVLEATETTPEGIAIGLALLPAIIMPFVTLNFLWAVRKMRAARRGENVIGRWRVPAPELAAFTANNAARNALGTAYHNEWKPPRQPAADGNKGDGIEIIFIPDGVVVGPAYFALVMSGPFRFTGVHTLPENPPAIEFGVVTTLFSPERTYRFVNALRLPVSTAASAELARVVDHFQRVARRELIVNPHFYRGRLRFGLGVAAIGSIPSALGFFLAAQARQSGNQDLETIAEGLAIGSLIIAGAGLFLAALAWKMRRRQQRGQ
jgi:hypothetical protein